MDPLRREQMEAWLLIVGLYGLLLTVVGLILWAML